MKNLALAAICGVFHFEFADDDDVDPDLAAQAIEEIFAYLQNSTDDEKDVLAEALAELRAEAQSGSWNNAKERVSFYDTFMKDVAGESENK